MVTPDPQLEDPTMTTPTPAEPPKPGHRRIRDADRQCPDGRQPKLCHRL